MAQLFNWPKGKKREVKGLDPTCEYSDYNLCFKDSLLRETMKQTKS